MEMKTAGDLLTASAMGVKKNFGGKGSPCNLDTNNTQSA